MLFILADTLIALQIMIPDFLQLHPSEHTMQIFLIFLAGLRVNRIEDTEQKLTSILLNDRVDGIPIDHRIVDEISQIHSILNGSIQSHKCGLKLFQTDDIFLDLQEKTRELGVIDLLQERVYIASGAQIVDPYVLGCAEIDVILIFVARLDVDCRDIGR